MVRVDRTGNWVCLTLQPSLRLGVGKHMCRAPHTCPAHLHTPLLKPTYAASWTHTWQAPESPGACQRAPAWAITQTCAHSPAQRCDQTHPNRCPMLAHAGACQLPHRCPSLACVPAPVHRPPPKNSGPFTMAPVVRPRPTHNRPLQTFLHTPPPRLPGQLLL